MAIKLYVGINGSGKSYEVVTNAILNALREGRRVVSNLAGLNYLAFCDVLIAEGVPAEKIGTILQVTHDQVLAQNFFRADSDVELGIETVIQPGDLVVLDEIWRFWENRNSVTLRQLNFFRMHRHMVHPVSGLTCEVVLITQLVSDVQQKIRGVVEQTFAMKKHTELGLDEYYRVSVYTGAPTNFERVDPILSLQKKYNPEYFKLYKSHSVNSGEIKATERSIDKRGNVFNRKLFRIVLPLGFVLSFFPAYFLWNFFHPKIDKPALPVSVSVPLAASGVPVTSRKSSPPVSEDWRVIGWYWLGSDLEVALKGKSGVMRYLHNPPDYKIFSNDLVVKLPEGDFVTTYGGKLEDTGKGMVHP